VGGLGGAVDTLLSLIPLQQRVQKRLGLPSVVLTGALDCDDGARKGRGMVR
jgi:hypothetical protein